MTRFSTGLILAFATAVFGSTAVGAERPTEAQKEALRSACRGDFIKHCNGVTPGGLPALECLERNMASLSEACQAAVKPVEAETGTGG